MHCYVLVCGIDTTPSSRPQRSTSPALPEPLRAEAESVAKAFLLGYSGNTRAAYMHDLRDFGAFCNRVGVDPLQAPRAVIEAYARELEEMHGRSPATVARRLAALSGFYEYAVDEGLLSRSPVTRVRRPRQSRESPSLGLDRGELRRFLDAAEACGPRDHAIATLLALNGLRVSEICGADVDDLGTERGHRTITITRKGGRLAQVPLAPRTDAAIAEHVGERTTGPLVLANDGGRLDRFDAGRIVRRLARRARIDHKVSPHDLRHGFITAALDAGVPLRDVQDAAGHTDPRTTRRYDRARHSLDRHPTYTVARYVA